MSTREEFLRSTDLLWKFSIFEESVFRPFHETLLPILMLEKSRNKLQAEDKAKNSGAGLFTYGLGLLKNELTVEEAYEQLLKSEPKNDLEQILKLYFLRNLPSSLKNSAP